MAVSTTDIEDLRILLHDAHGLVTDIDRMRYEIDRDLHDVLTPALVSTLDAALVLVKGVRNSLQTISNESHEVAA